MTKIFTIIVLFFATWSINAQTTYVPDDNFEQALIDLGYDTGALDDYVPTANINGITYLYLNSKNISDLSGIEDFLTLTNLYCSENQLTSLDVTSNTALIILSCSYNELRSLDVRNGNNANITYFDASDNPDLSCIYVDDKDAAYLLDWTKDATAEFANSEAECGGASVNEIVSNIFSIYPNPTNSILNFDFAESNIQKLTISDITGKILIKKTTVKQTEAIDISSFNNGIFIVSIQTDNKIFSSKIIKQN